MKNFKGAICGIYLIENNITKVKYIGQSVDCWRRINEHCNRDKLLIDQAIHFYGIENFNFTIIKRCKKKMLNFWENYYIYKYDTYKNGYNNKVNEKLQEKFKKLYEENNL